LDASEIVLKVLKGDKRWIARLISQVENSKPNVEEVLAKLHPHTGRSHIVGVTGPPGVGKSCLINELIKVYRKLDRQVGAILVDPSSPISGGAFLGDRIRVQEHSTDPKVFIRSMGTRGWSGGLAEKTADIIKILDASGSDIIFVETVGTGQNEVDIAHLADTLIVVIAPMLGDEIQAIKAGIFEVGDILVINKADMEDADRTLQIFRESISLEKNSWKIPIIKTVTLTGEGVEELAKKINEHEAYLKSSGKYKAKSVERVKNEILRIALGMLKTKISTALTDEASFRELVEKTLNRELDPVSAAKKIVEKVSS
jgi:LAO/AO transport system kinase